MQDVADLLEQCQASEGGNLVEQKELRESPRRTTDALNTATTDFAARRMDKSVRQALTGRSMEQLSA
jgi:hypothetical protein